MNLATLPPAVATLPIEMLSLLLAALVVEQLLGVSPALLLTASSIGAAPVGFRGETLVENLLSGVMIYLLRPFTVGDWIELPDKRLAGTVRTIGRFYTELLTAEREPLDVPDALFAGIAVANGSRRDHHRLLLEVSLRPEDAERAAAITAELRHSLAHDSAIDQELPRPVHVSAIDQRGLQLKLEAFGPADPEAAQNLRQELLLALAAAVRRQGAAFSSAQDGADPPRHKSATLIVAEDEVNFASFLHQNVYLSTADRRE